MSENALLAALLPGAFRVATEALYGKPDTLDSPTLRWVVSLFEIRRS